MYELDTLCKYTDIQFNCLVNIMRNVCRIMLVDFTDDEVHNTSDATDILGFQAINFYSEKLIIEIDLE